MARTVRRWAAAAVLGALITGCGTAATTDEGRKAGEERPKTEVSVRPIAAARQITDPHGHTVATKAPPRRIVCLVALCDDMLTELGLTPAATNSGLLAHPGFLGKEAAARVPVVPGGFIAPETEAILSHKPDLVIGLEDTHGKLAPALEGATVFWPVQPRNWQDSVGYLRGLAALTGRTAQGEDAERAFRAKLAAAEKNRSGKTALIIFGSDENFGVATPGRDVAGGLMPGLADYPWKDRGVEGTYSMEEILARDVDVLFVETLSFGGSDGKLSEKLAENPLWSRIPAVREGAVHEVDAEVWAKGRGTRSLGIVLDEATAALR
ncbi:MULTISPECIES: ABC transporter substrate-binding protein [Streptomyces]|uniref:Putative ABC transporter substrate-binding lipoprotein YhfQ n=2 Tax=Streptomyces TaxID=1883 RepID=A0A1D8G8S2_9ACTN|nr:MULTISPECIES: ABC transporter substrate-binding protein [Streptomyces]AOT61849.1 Putative ABC transporter substrate-binding lipoprotein YhfQ precursor [Streptomyces rubrolavendulae]OSY50366.1 putative ABC transporter substrate-binding lipoprotein YhfQ precursor [Streptomyces fradiae ATCC 10745 = DSM 40063]QEV14757.1 ABC transporter substrate-binding protein [Streptomyces fradiae ATCC 10745 = DSM 40063]UQS29578.1 ABC transporter substrate-binding protein [Streptomyces fradiae]